MACTGCTSKFSLMRPEYSCNTCNFSFCNKCLKKDVRKGNSGKVCLKCSQKSNANTNEQIEPPALLIKRLESLENPAKPPVTMFQAGKRLETLKRGLSEEDKKIVDRLEKLKEQSRISVPTETEIKERLQLLQGKDPVVRPKVGLGITPVKTSQQQVDDLLMEYVGEMSLADEPVAISDDLESRLAVLKGTQNLPNVEQKMDADSEEEGEAASNIVKRAVEEAALPDSGDLTPPNFSPLEWEPNESELPWCELCNEDASVRCINCEGALYCQRCLKESHDGFDLKHHKTLPFQQKATKFDD